MIQIEVPVAAKLTTLVTRVAGLSFVSSEPAGVTLETPGAASITFEMRTYTGGSTVAPHTHAISDVTGLRSELDDLAARTDKNYVHIQGVPSASWVVLHNMGKYPAVHVIDSSNEWVLGEISYDNLNQVTLTFSGAFSGKAICN